METKTELPKDFPNARCNLELKCQDQPLLLLFAISMLKTANSIVNGLV
jgi:hypothetical protein